MHAGLLATCPCLDIANYAPRMCASSRKRKVERDGCAAGINENFVFFEKRLLQAEREDIYSESMSFFFFFGYYIYINFNKDTASPSLS